jgi:type IV secretion system protein VirB10
MFKTLLRLLVVSSVSSGLFAQEDAGDSGLRTPDPPKAGGAAIEPGTKIPLTLLNTLSSKQTAPGDRVYLETLFPVMVNGKIVIPPGSYVSGTVTQVKRPGRIKGKGELYLRFDSLILPNGVVRDFRARIGGMEGGGNNELDREEGKIKGGGSKGEDARDIAQGAQIGTMAGGIAGAIGGRPVTGIAGGAGAGAAAGLLGVLLTRGPDVVLPKGSVVEMMLDRSLYYDDKELDFSSVPQRTTRTIVAPAENSNTQRQSNWPFPF